MYSSSYVFSVDILHLMKINAYICRTLTMGATKTYSYEQIY